jgi:hypothetical protein
LMLVVQVYLTYKSNQDSAHDCQKFPERDL